MKNVITRERAEKWNLRVAHALRDDQQGGTWFHELRQFPAALMDVNGYVKFDTAADYLSSGVVVSVVHPRGHTHIKDGISSLPRYVRMTGRWGKFRSLINLITGG